MDQTCFFYLIVTIRVISEQRILKHLKGKNSTSPLSKDAKLLHIIALPISRLHILGTGFLVANFEEDMSDVIPSMTS